MKGFASARRALELDLLLPLAHTVLGNIHLRARHHREALASTERAVELTPGDADVHFGLADVLSLGRALRRGAGLACTCAASRSAEPADSGLYTGRALLISTATKRPCPVSKHASEAHAVFTASASAHVGRIEEARAIMADPPRPGGYASISDIRQFGAYLGLGRVGATRRGVRNAGTPE